MVEALKKAGGNPKFTVYPEAGHDSWTEAYNDPQLYEWLLQQKRTPKKADDEEVREGEGDRWAIAPPFVEGTKP